VPSAPDDQVATALAAALARRLGPDVTISEVRRLAGGSSLETWSFDAATASGPLPLILRRDPGGMAAGDPLPGIEFGPSTDRDTEYRVHSAVVAAGVPAPPVHFALEPGDGLGAGYVMGRVEGETIARRILREQAYAPARAVMARQCGEILARLHGPGVAGLPALPLLTPEVQLDQYRGLLDSLGEPHPVFELALRWLQEHLPPAGPARLVHGDFRNGNFIVGPEGIRAVLDWELAHLGDPMEDLGWLCVKSWRYGESGKPVGGFGQREELFAAYEAAGGTPVDPATVRFWEVFGTLRWGEICLYQAFRHLSGLHRSVELAAIGRRASETEWDLLALIG